MPRDLQADIDWHKGRIDFYSQAMTALAAGNDFDKEERLAGLRTIVDDLQRTMLDLERALAAISKAP